MAQGNGGIIGKLNAPTVDAAAGVWTKRDMELAQQANKWPQTAYQYQIARSLRFNSADSAHLKRTPVSAGNRKTWTWSAWVKRSKLGTRQQIFNARPGSSEVIEFYTNDVISMFDYTGGVVYQLNTTQVFRDVSAWYHIVWMKDTTQATDTNRMKLYVNGVQVTAFSSTSYPPLNSESYINNTVAHHLGTTETTDLFLDGYMADVHFIDGQALTASSFGEIDANTGVWIPKAYAGTYGTNGFRLNFSDNSGTTATTLGKDSSPNGNNWTPNNFSVTAGAGNDSLVDSPTSYGLDSGAGGTVRGNYATLNPLNATPSALISNGNLYALSNLSGHYTSAPATISVTSGKWYAEVVFTRVAGSTDGYYVGVADAAWQASQIDGGGWYGRWWRDGTGYAYGDAGNKITGTTSSAYGATYTQGDVIGIALDMDAGTLTFYKNGTSQGVAFTGITGTKTMAAGAYKDTGITLSFDINLGQRPFAYTAPSGFKALCTQNLPTPAVGATAGNRGGNHFNAIKFTGDSANPRSFTGFGFSPDLIWSARRDVSYGIQIFDSVRGAGKRLNTGYPSLATAAEDSGYGLVGSFDADGYTSTAVDQASNNSGGSYVTWAWNAGESTVSNTAGSITSSVRANPNAGISVVNWTQPASGTYTIGHGLGVAPAMIIMKSRTVVSNWAVYHQSLGYTQYGLLNLSNSFAADSSVWVSAPTSSVFSQLVNYGTGGTSIAYCFAEVQGFSKFSLYTGNGSADGPFVYCGFRPKYVLIKKSSSTDEWFIWDTVRSTINQITGGYICTSTTAIEGTTYAVMDVVSNGFKIRGTDTSWNMNGATYIFAAFAEFPFKYGLAS